MKLRAATALAAVLVAGAAYGQTTKQPQITRQPVQQTQPAQTQPAQPAQTTKAPTVKTQQAQTQQAQAQQAQAQPAQAQPAQVQQAQAVQPPPGPAKSKPPVPKKVIAPTPKGAQKAAAAPPAEPVVQPEPELPPEIAPEPGQPNILFVMMDNLGYGELGVYGGGATRGAATPRIDQLAAEGMKLTNFNVETQSAASRSAFMTGRFAIRSGTQSVSPDEAPDGMTQWETTIAETLSEAGYATNLCGVWNLGSDAGRLPTAQGFDQWYGIPRTTNDTFWPGSPQARAAGTQLEQVMDGRKGDKTRNVAGYDLDQRRKIDADCTKRTIDFMNRAKGANKPFFAYLPYTLVHLPTLPNVKFAGKTGNGDFADALAEMDANVGQLLDALDAMGAKDNTIVVFTSDNGPEASWPWQGSAGPWRGDYATHMEGALRAPFLIRWPGHVAPGRVSNEVVHAVDMFTTLTAMGKGKIPEDRPIDGVDQTEFLAGRSETSARQGFPVYIGDRLEAVKWGNWKVVFYEEQSDTWSPPRRLGQAKVFDLFNDPREEYPQGALRNSRNAGPAMKVVADFEESLKQYPPIEPGTPDPYTPPTAPDAAPPGDNRQHHTAAQ